MELHEFWQVRDKLSMVDNIILYGAQRILIPETMRKQVLRDLHAAHEGQERPLQQARTCSHTWAEST